jgi:hypothetical protein
MEFYSVYKDRLRVNCFGYGRTLVNVRPVRGENRLIALRRGRRGGCSVETLDRYEDGSRSIGKTTDAVPVPVVAAATLSARFVLTMGHV